MKKLMIPFFIVCLLVSPTALLGSGKKKTVLFPKREYIITKSGPFFKEVNLTFPEITRVEFFVKTETYRSAYIHLGEQIAKKPYFKELLTSFNEENPTLISDFQQHYKDTLTIETYTETIDTLKLTRATFLLLLCHTIYHDYHANQLSGNNAFKLWNIILNITHKAYKDKNKTADNAAVLTVSSHLVFFKQSQKWKKKAKKTLKKKPDLKTNTHKDIELILKYG